MHVIWRGGSHTSWLHRSTVSTLKEGRDRRQRTFRLVVLNRRRQRRLRTRVDRSEVRLVVPAAGLKGRGAVNSASLGGIRPRLRNQIGDIHGEFGKVAVAVVVLVRDRK